MSLKDTEQKLIHAMKEMGLYRKVEHEIDDFDVMTCHGKPVDAMTKVFIYQDKDDKVVAIGQAYKSVSDKNYHRRLGRVIAMGRAMKRLGFSIGKQKKGD